MEDVLEEVFFCIESENFKLAKVLLKKSAKKYPKHYMNSYGQALLACHKDELEKAVDLFLQSIRIEPEYPFSHYNLAITLKKLGRVDLAIKHYWATLQCASADEVEIMPEVVQVIDILKSQLPDGFTVEAYLQDAELFEQAVELMELEQFDKAVGIFEGIAKNQPDHVQARGNLGICNMVLGDFDKAKELFGQALSLDPDYEPASSNLNLLKQLESGELKKLPRMYTRHFYAEKTRNTRR